MATVASIPAAEFHPVELDIRLGIPFQLMAAAYCQWKLDGLFPLIFHRCPDVSLMDFLDWNYQPTVESVGCFNGEQLVGIGWICQAWKVDGRVVAEVGAAFFKGTPLSLWHRSVYLMLRHVFEEREFDAVYGLSAKCNRAANLIARRGGAYEADRLPWPEDVAADTVIWKLDREAWRNHHG